ncbi:DUF4349 domain-containing protein [Nanoarchaeota archaeon]
MIKLKDTLEKAKKNWFAILVVIILLFLAVQMNPLDYAGSSDSSYDYKSSPSGGGVPSLEEARFDSVASPGSPGVSRAEVQSTPEPRKVTKTARMTNEVEHGEYESASEQVKEIVSSSGSILLNEDVDRFETEREGVYYHIGDYEIKIEVDKYDSVLEELKLVGEVDSFNERTRDITEQYEDLEVELESEKARLVRYNEMYAKADEVEFQIDLIDRIFNQERIIKYLEEAIKNLDKKVDYSTVNLRINEEQPDFGEVKFFGIVNLFESFLASLLALVGVIFWVLPWVIAFWLIMKIRKWWLGRKKR